MRTGFQFRLRALMIAVTLFCFSAATFTAYYPLRYETDGPLLYLCAFALLGASCGSMFGLPGLGMGIGLVAAIAVFFNFPSLLFNPDARAL